MNKTFKGKAIYNPSGKAGEYSYWACNFYVGCSNGCSYCYLKKGRGASVFGGSEPTLKKCFRGEAHAIEIFEKELLKNKSELQKHGLFFSFTTDPLLFETIRMTEWAVEICGRNDIPVKILSKDVSQIDRIIANNNISNHLVAVGFTLTGHDELEEKASTNRDRILALEVCKSLGFKTFASIEPIIDFESSKRMIEQSYEFCDLFKIGLEGGKAFDKIEAENFVSWLTSIKVPKIYLKENLRKLAGDSAKGLDDYFVERDYNMFI